MSLFSSITAGIETVTEIVEDAINKIRPETMQERSRRMIEERQQAEQRARDEREAQRRTDNERVLAYLQQPRRTIAEVQADITAQEAERVILADELAAIEAEIVAGDHEANVKTATRHSQITLTLKAIGGRLARLHDELAEARKVDILNKAQASVTEYVERAEALLAYEAGEFAEIEAQYKAALEHCRQERAFLVHWQYNHRQQLINQGLTPDLHDHVVVIEAPHPIIHTIWRQR